MTDVNVLVALRDAWRRSEPVVAPTDTVPGLVAPAADETAVRRLFAAKQRPLDRRMAVLVADLEQAAAWIEVDDRTTRLADRFWPGGLTIVRPRRPAAPAWVGDDDTLGVRCPDDARLRGLAAEVGPLAATSANLHGAPPVADETDAAATFPGLVVIPGSTPAAPASTVVVLGPGTVEIVREGPVAAEAIGAALATRP